MLSTPTPFPHVGSFALYIDPNLPTTQQRAEMVRIMRVEGAADGRAVASPSPLSEARIAAIAFPNRAGAAGNRTVPLSELIDAAPLTRAEEHALTDMLGDLRDRARLSPRLKAVKAQADALRSRQIHSHILESEVAVMRAREAREDRRQGGSIGRPLPRESEAA